MLMDLHSLVSVAAASRWHSAGSDRLRRRVECCAAMRAVGEGRLFHFGLSGRVLVHGAVDCAQPALRQNRVWLLLFSDVSEFFFFFWHKHLVV
jgi:hypothetical protein